MSGPVRYAGRVWKVTQFCVMYYKWVHKRCSAMNGRLQEIIGFECVVCR